jgi:hypothetical protein
LNTENFIEIGIEAIGVETFFDNDLCRDLNMGKRQSLSGFFNINQLKLKKFSMYKTRNDKENNKKIFEKIEEIQKKTNQSLIELIKNCVKKPNLPFRAKIVSFYNLIFDFRRLEKFCDRLIKSDYCIISCLKSIFCLFIMFVIILILSCISFICCFIGGILFCYCCSFNYEKKMVYGLVRRH